MKREILYILLGFFSGIIHLLILLLSSGRYIPLLLLFSYLLNITILFLALHIFTFHRKEDSNDIPAFKKASSPEPAHSPAREVTDPKASAEKLFKNVLLKRSVRSFGEKLLINFAASFDIMQGIFYEYKEAENTFEAKASYAISARKNIKSFSPGESIPGQAVLKDNLTILSNIPPEYRIIESGLGKHGPEYLYFIPLIQDRKCLALIEISTFREISGTKLNVLNFFTGFGGKKFARFKEKIIG